MIILTFNSPKHWLLSRRAKRPLRYAESISRVNISSQKAFDGEAGDPVVSDSAGGDETEELRRGNKSPRPTPIWEEGVPWAEFNEAIIRTMDLDDT